MDIPVATIRMMNDDDENDVLIRFPNRKGLFRTSGESSEFEILDTDLVRLFLRLRKCISREEAEEYLLEKEILTVEFEEFQELFKYYTLAPLSRKLLDIAREQKLSAEDSALFDAWLFRGIKKFKSVAEELALQSTNAALWEEYQDTAEHYFLSERHQEELSRQRAVAARLKEALDVEKFQRYIASFGNGYILGTGHKPCKSAVIRYLQKQGAWLDGMTVDDVETTMHGYYTSSLGPCITLFAVGSGLLEAMHIQVPIPGKIYKFINARCESRSDARFSDMKRRVTAGEARLFFRTGYLD